MRMFMKMIWVVSALLLVGCGGGDGAAGTTSSPSTLAYEGKTGPADLDLNGVKALVEDVDIPYGDLISLADNTNNKIEMKTIATTQHLKKVKGDISGTVDTEEEYVDELTTKTTMIFTDFNDGDGIINGKIIFVKSYNRSLYDDANMTEGGVYLGDIRGFYVKKLDIRFENLNIKDSESDITMQGSFVKESEGEGKSLLTQNLIVKNNTDNQMIKLENFIIALDQFERALSYNGRIYDSENGYIDVSTPSELKYDTEGRPAVGGIIKYEGKETIAFEKTAYENSMRIEIDDGKDGNIDAVEIYDSETLEVIPNRKPIINVTLPQSIYTDTNMSQVKVEVYDPDLDGFTTGYEWQINGDIKSNEKALSNTLFVKHDKLKLTVTATDDRVGDTKTNTQTKEQDVLNSRPVILSSFEKIQANLGDTKQLNYSVSDADDDEIFISWKHYFVNSFGGEETINEYYHPIFTQDCALAIEDYDVNHPNTQYSTLSQDEQEDFNRTYCSEDIPGRLVSYKFIEGKTFDAVAPGLYFHEMIVDDGEANRTKVFDSNISKPDIVDKIENNHDQYSTNRAYNIFMKDFDNDGNNDLIYMGSVTKHEDGSSVTDPSGEVMTMEPFDYQLPILVIEYRNGDSIIRKDSYEVNTNDLSNFYVNDLDGDGKLDILLIHSNSYSPPTNKNFSVMLQKNDGMLSAEIEASLVNYNAFTVSDVTGDGSSDIILNTSAGIKIFNEDRNITIPTSIPDSLENYGVSKKILVEDLDNNDKNDIVIVNKNFTDNSNKLTFVCSVISQSSDRNFSEKIYEKTLGTNLDEYEAITDMVISDFDGMKNLFVVSTTQHIYILKLENDTATIIKKLDYLNTKNKLSTKILAPIDINHDGKKDLIVLDTSLSASSFVNIFIQREDFDFFAEQNYSFESGYSSFNDPSYTIGDINNDGKYEIFFSTGEENLSSIWFK